MCGSFLTSSRNRSILSFGASFLNLIMTTCLITAFLPALESLSLAGDPFEGLFRLAFVKNGLHPQRRRDVLGADHPVDLLVPVVDAPFLIGEHDRAEGRGFGGALHARKVGEVLVEDDVERLDLLLPRRRQLSLAVG